MTRRLKRSGILWLVGTIVIAVFFSLIIFSSDYQKYAIDMIKESPYLAPIVIVFFRFIGVVAAPLPGSPIAFASMAVLPWYEAWAWNFIGTETGAIVAFIIARKFREPVVARFAPLSKIHNWQDKISQNKQLWAFTGFRLVSLAAFDFVSYAAGLTKLPFRTFIIATFIIDIPINFLFFYLGGQAVEYSIFIFGAFILLFVIVSFLWVRIWRKGNREIV